ncbi:MAG: hypothetical protein STSR0009_23630 [Methanoregula sp.]
MQVQYIYDENGTKTGVIVPIALWQKISQQNGNKKDLFEPSKFRGIYRGITLDLESTLQNLRKEWERV